MFAQYVSIIVLISNTDWRRQKLLSADKQKKNIIALMIFSQIFS